MDFPITLSDTDFSAFLVSHRLWRCSSVRLFIVTLHCLVFLKPVFPSQLVVLIAQKILGMLALHIANKTRGFLIIE